MNRCDWRILSGRVCVTGSLLHTSNTSVRPGDNQKKQITESGLRTHKKQVTSSGLVTSRPVIEYIRFVDRSVIHAARKIDTRYKYVSAFIFLINR